GGRRRGRDRGRLVVRLVLLVLVVVNEPQIDHDSSPGRSHVFVASLAGEPIVAVRGLQVVDGRSPNRPRPMRSMVLPSCTATSRSSVIPIDLTGRASRSARATRARKPGRAA